MKANLLIITLLLLALKINAQTYILDESFGTNGQVEIYSGFFPERVLYIDGNYMIGGTVNGSAAAVKISYDGSIDTTFGDNGYVNLPSGYNFSEIKFDNGHFYICGNVEPGQGTTRKGYIAKFDTSGNFETGFGDNGVADIDLGEDMFIRDFIIEPAGKIFCIGSRKEAGDFKIIYFKADQSGNIDTSFDVNGYKQLDVAYGDGYCIKYLNGQILLIGITESFSNNTPYQDMVLTKVNTNGVVDTAYGNMGYKVVSLEGGGTNVIKGVEISGDEMFVNYNYAYSFTTNGNHLLNYNLATDVIMYDDTPLYNYHLKIYDNQPYISGYQRCPSLTDNACARDFILKRLDATGAVDATFNNTGSFTYNFLMAGPWSSEDRSGPFVRDDNGRMLIAGYTHGNFGMIRIGDASSLSVHSVSRNLASIAPNPFSDVVFVSGIENLTAVELIDLEGRVISHPDYSIVENGYRVDLSGISQTGIYFLKTTAAGTVHSFKIVKM